MSLAGIGEGAERELLESFGHVSTVFMSLPEPQQTVRGRVTLLAVALHSPPSSRRAWAVFSPSTLWRCSQVIADITARMGDGMALYIARNLKQGTVDIADYNMYCHFVAGLVGEGLSRIFSCAGFEGASRDASPLPSRCCVRPRLTVLMLLVFDCVWRAAPDVAEQVQLANDMGLFLQKTNIIRDYLEVCCAAGAHRASIVVRRCVARRADAERADACCVQDFVDGRAFWPKEIWGEYASNLGDFAKAPTRKAMTCLNHMIADALAHVPSCLRYLCKLGDPSVFRFCAIPQVMAIATLEELASNPKVFTGVVKIRKGMAVKVCLARLRFHSSSSLCSVVRGRDVHRHYLVFIVHCVCVLLLQLMMDAADMSSVFEIFLDATRSIQAKLSGYPAQRDMIAPVVRKVEGICLAGLPHRSIRNMFDSRIFVVIGAVLLLLLRYLSAQQRNWHGHLLPTLATAPWDVRATASHPLASRRVASCCASGCGASSCQPLILSS